MPTPPLACPPRVFPRSISKDSFLLQPRQWYTDQRIELHLRGERVVAISTADKTVRLSSGEALPYDRLIYALGAINNAPPPAAPILSAPNGFTLRSLADAKRIRAAVVDGHAKKVFTEPHRPSVTRTSMEALVGFSGATS